MRNIKRDPLSSIVSTRRNLILLLISCIVIVNCFIVLSTGENRVFFSNWTINVASAIALGYALITVYRQKLDGLYGKTFASLAIGLGLWFMAEIIWTYFELGLNIDTPFPSIADAFWLMGYFFLAYHLYKIYNFVKVQSGKPVLIMVSICTAIIIGYIVYLTIAVSDLSTSYTQNQDSNNMLLVSVSIAYPILDGVLLIPAVLVLWAVRAGQLSYIHWMLLALSILIMAVADSGFGYISVSNKDTVQAEEWPWDICYNTSYLLIAGALFWHNRFFIFNEKAMKKKWQEQNR